MATIKQISQNLSTKSSNSYNWLLLVLALILVISAIWIPFGFSLAALIEEWDVLGTYATHGLYFIVNTSTPLAGHALRPLTIFPHSVAYFLDPNSFNYWHILLILALMVKGASLAYLVKKVTGSLQWALLASVLVILYPADTMQLAFRGLHINWALSLQLLASCLFIAAVQTQRVISYLITSFTAAVSMLAAIFMYEAAIVFIVMPFLMIYIKEGFFASFKLLRTRKILMICWAASLGVYLIYTHYMAAKLPTYQEQLIGGRGFFDFFAQPYSKLLSVGALRGLLGGWFDAFRMLFTEFGFYGYIYLILTATCIGIIFLLTHSLTRNSEYRQSMGIPSRLALVGFLLLLLGYLPYIFLPSHLVISQRTFLFASPGAVMCWLALLMLIAHWAKKVAYSLSFVLILAGMAAQLFQFHHYVQISSKQRFLLKNIVENYDGKAGKTLLILDKSNQINHTWMLLQANFGYALAYLYDLPQKEVEVCHIPGDKSKSDGWQISGTQGRPGKCIEHENSWTFHYPNLAKLGLGNPSTSPSEKILPKEDLFTLTIEPDSTVKVDPKLDEHRRNLYYGQGNDSLRFRNILVERSWTSHFTWLWKKAAAERYQWSFGDWWSLELPFQGNGWAEAGWEVNRFHHKALAWKTQKHAILQFDMRPATEPYVLKVHIVNMVSEEIRNSLKIRINNHDIPFHWLGLGNEELEASVPSSDLLSGINTLAFDSKTAANYYGLSFQVASIDLSPTNALSNSKNSEKKDKS